MEPPNVKGLAAAERLVVELPGRKRRSAGSGGSLPLELAEPWRQVERDEGQGRLHGFYRLGAIPQG